MTTQEESRSDSTTRSAMKQPETSEMNLNRRLTALEAIVTRQQEQINALELFKEQCVCHNSSMYWVVKELEDISNENPAGLDLYTEVVGENPNEFAEIKGTSYNGDSSDIDQTDGIHTVNPNQLTETSENDPVYENELNIDTTRERNTLENSPNHDLLLEDTATGSGNMRMQMRKSLADVKNEFETNVNNDIPSLNHNGDVQLPKAMITPAKDSVVCGNNLQLAEQALENTLTIRDDQNQSTSFSSSIFDDFDEIEVETTASSSLFQPKEYNGCPAPAKESLQKRSADLVAEVGAIDISAKCAQLQSRVKSENQEQTEVTDNHSNRPLLVYNTGEGSFEVYILSDELEETTSSDIPDASQSSPLVHSDDSGGGAIKADKARDSIADSKEKLHTCHLCPQLFHRKALLDDHVRTHPMSFTCKFCSTHFISHVDFKNHLQGHRKESPFTCRICDTVFTNSSNLMHHMNIHNGVNGTDRDKSTREGHMCVICGTFFSSEKNLEIHKDVHLGKELEGQNVGIAFSKPTEPRWPRSHQRTYEEKKRFGCAKCPKKFSSKQYLMTHESTHGQPATPIKVLWSCGDCKENFASEELLSTHSKEHLGTPLTVSSGREAICGDTVPPATPTPVEHVVQVCRICKIKYATTNALRLHSRKHKSRKIYKCRRCKMRFFGLDRFQFHQIIHFDHKSVKCGICSCLLQNKREFRIHSLSHSNVLPKPHLGRKPTKSGMKTIKNPFTRLCRICGETFCQFGLFHNHIACHLQAKKLTSRTEYRAVKLGYLTSGRRWKRKSIRLRVKGILPCVKCRKYFKRNALSTHMKSEHSLDYDVNDECTRCHKIFKNQAALLKHISFHKKRPRLQCRICSKQFTLETQLIRHLNTHGIKEDLSPKNRKIETRSEQSSSSKILKPVLVCTTQQQNYAYPLPIFINQITMPVPLERFVPIKLERLTPRNSISDAIEVITLSDSEDEGDTSISFETAEVGTIADYESEEVVPLVGEKASPNLGKQGVGSFADLQDELDFQELTMALNSFKSNGIKCADPNTTTEVSPTAELPAKHGCDVLKFNEDIEAVLSTEGSCSSSALFPDENEVPDLNALDETPMDYQNEVTTIVDVTEGQDEERILANPPLSELSVRAGREGDVLKFGNQLKPFQKKHNGEYLFQCPICEKYLPTQREAQAHTIGHSAMPSFNCRMCTENFLTRTCLAIHEETHAKESNLLGGLRKRKFKRSEPIIGSPELVDGSVLQGHSYSAAHKPAEVLNCQFVFCGSTDNGLGLGCFKCDKTCTSIELMGKHEEIHSGNRPFSCNLCDISFDTVANLKYHISQTHRFLPINSEIFTCKTCHLPETRTSRAAEDMTSSSDKPKPDRVEVGQMPSMSENSFNGNCSAISGSWDPLTRVDYITEIVGITEAEELHSDSTAEANPRQPDVESIEQLDSDDSDHEHYETTKPQVNELLKCSECGVMNYGYHRLKSHLLKHRDSSWLASKLNLECPFCNKVYKYFKGLKKHAYVTHDGRDVFLCTICTKVFRREKYLEQHIRTGHKFVSSKTHR